MENFGLKVGDLILILEEPRKPKEWRSPHGAHRIISLKTMFYNPYFYIESPTGFNAAGAAIAFDARRALKIDSLTALERLIYSV